jgi:hypothetical protein
LNKEMKLDYSLSKEQLRAFSKLSCQRLAASRDQRALLMALNIVGWAAIAFGVAALVGMYKAPAVSSELHSFVISLVLAAVALVGSFVYQQRLQSNAVFAEGSWPRVQQSISAELAGLEIKAPGVHTRYEWSRFVETLEDAAAIYLFLDAAHAVIVPKAAFATPDDMRNFLAWAKSPNKLHHATCETRAREQ